VRPSGGAKRLLREHPRRFTQAGPMGSASPDEVRELSEWLREMVAFG
jgi:hypothetical protein